MNEIEPVERKLLCPSNSVLLRFTATVGGKKATVSSSVHSLYPSFTSGQNKYG